MGAVTEANTRRSGRRLDRGLASILSLVPALSYPVWGSLAPPGSVDPLWAWIAVSGAFLAPALLHMAGVLSWSRMLGLIPWLASLVAIHFFVLASLNDMSPFYAVGSTMAGMAPVIFIRSWAAMVGYSTLILGLAAGLYLQDPDERKIAYWGSLFPVLAVGYYHVDRQSRRKRQLEQAVADRTRLLSEANRRLLDEIKERTRLEEELRVHHRMEAVGRLAGGVAHDFNNILSTIGIYSDLIAKRLAPDDPLQSEVTHIQEANRLASSITQQLLTVGRRSQAQTVALDLNRSIAEVEELLSHLAGEGNELVCRCSHGALGIRANPDQLRQILISLVTNARHSMDQSGVLTIETSNARAEDLPEPRLTAVAPEEEYALLSVSDTGRGMSPDTAERVFDPFFTTKGPEQGTGLGLAIVHGIVSEAGGFIRVHSEPGQGARFDLYWPRVDVTDAAEALPAPSRLDEARVLLVEDDAELRHGLALVLRVEGCEVREASCAELALEFLEREEQGFDLVVSDVIMKQMTGWQLAERVARDAPETRVLLISGHFTDPSIEPACRGFERLAKPFSASAFAERVRRLLDAA